MNSQPTLLLQRIQEGLPLSVRIEHEEARILDGPDRWTRFPVCLKELSPVEGSFDATLEVACHGHFLTAVEIQAHPLKNWLTRKDAAVRLVVNRDTEGKPLLSLPFSLEGIEVTVRPTLTGALGDPAWRIACLLPCHEVHVFAQAGDRSWKVLNRKHGYQGSISTRVEPIEESRIRDRFDELAAALPSKPTARPYGTPGEDTKKQREDWKGFRLRG
jgi:hypothetical protein